MQTCVYFFDGSGPPEIADQKKNLRMWVGLGLAAHVLLLRVSVCVSWTDCGISSPSVLFCLLGQTERSSFPSEIFCSFHSRGFRSVLYLAIWRTDEKPPRIDLAFLQLPSVVRRLSSRLSNGPFWQQSASFWLSLRGARAGAGAARH